MILKKVSVAVEHTQNIENDVHKNEKKCRNVKSIRFATFLDISFKK